MNRRTLFASLKSLVAGLTIAILATTPTVGAATSTQGSGNGLKVSPVTTNIVVEPGQTQVVTVYVQNVTPATVTLHAIINDFIASTNETGQPALLLDPGQYAPTHSLKRLVTPIGDVTLKPGQQKGVAVSITIPKGAPGGGYYGAVRFAPSSTSSSSNVTLSASVGSLILVRVPGNVKEDLELSSIDVRSGADGAPSVVFTGSGGLVAAVRFHNAGDVQEQPFGKILLKQGNTQLAAYEINNTTPRGNVLPSSIRKFTVNLTKVGAFGQYTIVGNFGYGSNGQLLSGQTTFYVIPIVAIVVIVLLLALIVFAIFGLPRLVRSYNAGVIRKASRR